MNNTSKMDSIKNKKKSLLTAHKINLISNTDEFFFELKLGTDFKN